MSGRLSGRTAMVVGAGSIGPGWGNGKATAVLFAREGARVFCVDLNETAAQETAELIRGEGGEAEVCQADATSSADVERAVASCVERFGGIDVLDNNVGILAFGGVVELPEAEWDRVFAVNVKSCFLAMKHAIPVMERAGGGSIVNISSIAGIRCMRAPLVGYYASKAALNHLTRATAVEYASRSIRVNAIVPGLMKTPMVEAAFDEFGSSYDAGDVDAMWRARDAQVPMGHMGDAWDVAHTALFLASDESRYVTGVALPVDGGISLKCA